MGSGDAPPGSNEGGGSGGGGMRLVVGRELEETLELTLVAGALEATPKECFVEMALDREPEAVAAREPAPGTLKKRVEVDVDAVSLIQNMPSGRKFLVRGTIILSTGAVRQSSWTSARTLPLTAARGDDRQDLLSNLRGRCTTCPCKAFRREKLPVSVGAQPVCACRGCGCQGSCHEIVTPAAPTVARAPGAGEEGAEPASLAAVAAWDERQRDMFTWSSNRFNPQLEARRRRPERPPPASPEKLFQCRVSVVCPTTDKRRNFHEQLWSVWDAQAWPDKELVVVETYVTEPSPVLSEKARRDSRIVFASFKVEPGNDWSIGLKRNICTHLASGFVIANFDDDDLYAPAYLQTMIRTMVEQKCEAITLNSWYIFDAACGKVGYCDARGHGFLTQNDKTYGYGFSYMFLRHLSLMFPYPNTNLGEDTPFFNRIRSQPGSGALGGFRRIALLADEYGVCCHTLHPDSTSSVRAQHEIPESEMGDLECARLACWGVYLSRFPRIRDKSRYIGSVMKHRALQVRSSQGDLAVMCSPAATAGRVKELVAEQAGGSPKEMSLYRAGPASGAAGWALDGDSLQDSERVGTATTELWLALPADRESLPDTEVEIFDSVDGEVSAKVEIHRVVRLAAVCRALAEQHAGSLDPADISLLPWHEGEDEEDWSVEERRDACDRSEWLGLRRAFRVVGLAEMVGQRRRCFNHGPLGWWIYNGGRSCYEIDYLHPHDATLGYQQPMSGGRILYGMVQPAEGDANADGVRWQWEAVLDSGGRLRLRREGRCMVSSYLKPEGTAWTNPVCAEPVESTPFMSLKDIRCAS